MQYYGRYISSAQRAAWLVRTFWLKRFGSEKDRFIDPDTGAEVENGMMVASIREEACWSWCMAVQDVSDDDNFGKFRINKDFINSCIFDEIATDEEKQEKWRIEECEAWSPC